ncbi:uncharacterized protein LOC111371967 [Olea europaea var. sylvestris]|uniref:uncharacterized protein LOC111371967 n=1 Tax=Olea europaea var. sylvestris TaxID=158386 RepID=UPI000C1D49AC|nr:uncharacterized protein LOC111371967 [Olea europaea var. sylvestris]
MAFFEALYGRKCRTSACWDKVSERKCRRNLEFDIGDRVFLRLLPWKGVIRFGKREFMMYSMFRKYISNPSYVLKSQPVELKENLTYEEEPVQLLDKKKQVSRTKTIPLIKILWGNHTVEEATWEIWNLCEIDHRLVSPVYSGDNIEILLEK